MRKSSTGDLNLLDKGTRPAVIVSMVSRKLTIQELSKYTSRDYPWGDLYAYFGVAFLKTRGDWLLIDMMIYSFFIGLAQSG